MLNGKTMIVLSTARLIIVTRNNIVWKLARGSCLCYCQTFLLVPDSTECTKKHLPKRAVHYLYHRKSNNIIGQGKTTNTKKHFFSMIDFVKLKTFLHIANNCK